MVPNPVTQSTLVKSKYTTLASVFDTETLSWLYLFGTWPVPESHVLAGNSYKTHRLLPRQGKACRVPYLGMWSEISVFWQLSRTFTFRSSSQLQIVTDDHKCLHQSTSMQAVRPTRTDTTYPLLCPLQAEEEKNDFWAQAERWWATFLTSFHIHTREPESMQVLVCFRCK